MPSHNLYFPVYDLCDLSPAQTSAPNLLFFGASDSCPPTPHPPTTPLPPILAFHAVRPVPSLHPVAGVLDEPYIVS
jgi:hypothetical protein